MAFKEKFLSWLPTTSLKPRDLEGGRMNQAQGSANSSLIEYYMERTNITNKRSDVYEDMDEMDDEIIARALDMESDDATQMDLRKNKSVWITSSDPKKKQVIEDMFRRIQLEQRIWLWSRDTNKYGDFFVRLSIDPDKGLISVQDNYHPKEVVRLEDKGKLAGFLLLDTHNQSLTPHLPHEWIHFRNIRYRVQDDLMPQEFYRKYQIDKNARYGSPGFVKVRRIEKQLRLAEDSLVLGRLAQSQYTQIHYVNVGDADTKEQKNIVDNYENLFHKDRKANYNDSTFQAKHSSLSYADRVFVPVRTNEKGRSNVEEVGGNLDVTSIADIEMLNNKRFGALGIPKEYMSFDSTLGFNTLMQLDPRYARKIANLQRNLIAGLTQMAQIELYIHGLDTDAEGFQIEMTSVSTTNELERTDSLNALIDAGDRMVRFFQNVDDQIDQVYLYRYIVNTYLRLPDINLDRLFKDKGLEMPDTNGQEPENPQQFFNSIEKAVESDPKIGELLREFVASVMKGKNSVALKQRVLRDAFNKDTLKYLDEKDQEEEPLIKKRETELKEEEETE